MTYATTPIQAVFETQRQSIIQGQQLFEQGLALQQNAAKTFLRNGLAAGRSARDQAGELAREVTDAQFDAAESAVDRSESEVRSAIEEQFQQNAALTQQLLNAQFEQGADVVEQLLDAQFDVVQSALDDEQFDVRAAVDEQFAAFDESQNETWDELETTFLDAVDDLSEQQRALLAQTVQATLDAHRDAEQQTVEGAKQTVQTAGAVQRQGQEVARTAQDSVQDVAADAAEAVERQADALDTSLEAIEGLGSTYAARLREQGIESVTHLSQANLETIAETADVSREQAERWSEAAQSQA